MKRISYLVMAKEYGVWHQRGRFISRKMAKELAEKMVMTYPNTTDSRVERWVMTKESVVCKYRKEI